MKQAKAEGIYRGRGGDVWVESGRTIIDHRPIECVAVGGHVRRQGEAIFGWGMRQMIK